MAIVTTRNGNGLPQAPKPFSWSYSRLKNFEACPKRHFEIDLSKNVKEADGEALLWGNAVHNALAARCGPAQTPLPEGMKPYEHWAQKVLAGGGDIHVEQNMALARDFQACGYFDKGDRPTWFRAKVDFIKIIGDVALIVDWKTGKILEDSQQLALTAACVFAKHPDIAAVRASFVWLKEDAESSETFMKDDMPYMWRNLWPRIEALERAHNEMNYPPIQNRLCRSWCPVTKCPYHGTSF